ncbi:uncharacterized protein L3040_005165 [Drepanopeziza brunnea f. sp. 'multigermtubi']|uniref:uncharacterized protein n=1 Tax=Drepanopeziza brunnea f. sp. 'multigermtubi' TaxID=698441 RepID=UPI00239D64C1|nr:hypothetical protein L3040_005165 [Drepanopeziza brunnea f. sp. 'multigermtubi']
MTMTMTMTWTWTWILAMTHGHGHNHSLLFLFLHHDSSTTRLVSLWTYRPDRTIESKRKFLLGVNRKEFPA